MEWNEFEKTFATEQQCRDYLEKVRWKNGYRCPQCNGLGAWKTAEYKYKCKKCGHKISLTSGTIFQDRHIPLTTWFKAVWLISDDVELSARKLQKALDLGSNRTALAIKNKIHKGLEPLPQKLQGTVDVFITDIRWRDKPEHIGIAVELRKNKPGCISISCLKRYSSKERLDFIEKSVKRGSTISGNFWAGLDTLRSKGYIYKPRQGTYIFPCANKILTALKAAQFAVPIEKTLEDFLKEFCTAYNKEKSKTPFEKLLDNVIHLPPDPHKSKLKKPHREYL